MLLKASPVRAFERDDIRAVAALWQRCFRHSEVAPSAALRDYFEEIFFRNPWGDGELPSLVYGGEGGEVAGFIGVIPRRMRFKEREIRVAVATQLMVDPSKRRGFAAMELIRRVFAGPQDLVYSDGANDLSEMLWRMAGGQSAPLYCIEWTRVVRPAEFVAQRVAHRRGTALAGRLCRPIGRLVDAVSSKLRLNPFHPEAGRDTWDDVVTPEAILANLGQFSAGVSLRPDYDEASLRWLLEKAAMARTLGSLRAMLVRDEAGRAAGWYVYYANPGGTAQVLQLAATTKSVEKVLDSLFRDAWRQGALAVSGQGEPRFMTHLTRRHCQMSCPGIGVLVQSRDPEVAGAIQKGDAFLSRLDGEWWMRLGVDRHLAW